jgi:uncharacterized protein (DUF4415 family)
MSLGRAWLSFGLCEATRFVSYRFAGRIQRNGEHMKKAYDFKKGRRGAVFPAAGKTRITMFLDDAILRHFKALSENTGKGYQTLINEALAAEVSAKERPLSASAVRRIVREEITRRVGTRGR